MMSLGIGKSLEKHDWQQCEVHMNVPLDRYTKFTVSFLTCRKRCSYCTHVVKLINLSYSLLFKDKNHNGPIFLVLILCLIFKTNRSSAKLVRFLFIFAHFHQFIRTEFCNYSNGLSFLKYFAQSALVSL